MTWLLDNLAAMLTVLSSFAIAGCLIWLHAAMLADKREHQRRQEWLGRDRERRAS